MYIGNCTISSVTLLLDVVLKGGGIIVLSRNKTKNLKNRNAGDINILYLEMP